MYAIVFDLSTACLKQTYHNNSYNNAYKDINDTFEKHGFRRQQGSVFFGNDKVNAVACVLAIMELATKYPWFAPSVDDIRMLRIEEDNDLMPAVERVSPDRGAKKATALAAAAAAND